MSLVQTLPHYALAKHNDNAKTPLAFQLQGLSSGYGRRPAIFDVTGNINHGDLLAVVGSNGAGKSTFLKTLAGVLQPLSGTLTVKATKRKNRAYLPQATALDQNFPITVYELVAMGLWRRAGAFGAFGAKRQNLIMDALRQTGITDLAHRQIGALSGGQLRRALFARLILQNAEIILLDEPFVGIDAQTTHDLLGLMLAWHRTGRTIIAVLHDHDMVASHFATTLWLEQTVKAWGATADVLPLARGKVPPLGHVCDEACESASTATRPALRQSA